MNHIRHLADFRAMFSSVDYRTHTCCILLSGAFIHGTAFVSHVLSVLRKTEISSDFLCFVVHLDFPRRSLLERVTGTYGYAGFNSGL